MITKTLYSMTVPEGMQKRIVLNSRNRINELTYLIEKLTPEYKDKYEYYMQVKAEFEAVQKQMQTLQDDIKEEEKIIHVMRHFGEKPGEKVMKGHGEPRVGKHCPKQVKWLDEFQNILHKQNRFLSFDDLWATVSKDEELINKVAKTKSGTMGKMYRAVWFNLDKHCNMAPGQKNQVRKYNEKYGLPGWLDEKGVVLPRYLKEFIYYEPLRSN